MITTMTQYYSQNKTTIKTPNKTLTTAASAVLPTRKMNELYRNVRLFTNMTVAFAAKNNA